MSINSEQASGSWSISNQPKPTDKDGSQPGNSEIIDLSMNNRAEPSVPSFGPVFNPASNFRSIHDGFIMRENSDNNSVNSLNRKSITSNSLPSYKKINEIVRILPEFNGKNISINRFIRECKEAENFVSPGDKSFFLKIVKSRVTGDANDYLQFKSFDNLEQLLLELKRVFSPSQNLPQVQTDLARVRQNSNEKVSEYGLRVTKILQKARELIDENFNPLVARGMIEGTTNTAIECFTLGLESDIATRMIGKQFSTLESAISTAITCERYVHQRKELHGERADESRKRAHCHIAELRGEGEPEEKRKRNCYRCGELGHIARNCRKMENINLYCNYCKMWGHTFDSCRRQTRSTPFNNSQPLAIDYLSQSFPNNHAHPLNSNRVQHTGAMLNQPRRDNSASIPALLSLPMIPPRG